MLINAASLSKTVDAVNSAMWQNRRFQAREREQVAQWIAARQGLPGAYAETFAGFPAERDKGIVVFTGERIKFASARHVLGEEACRVLRLLSVRDRTVQAALDRASDGLMHRLREASETRGTNPGTYCCGKCTVGLWRHLLAGGLDRQEERLLGGVAHLRTARDSAAGWRRFPFWYTVLALAEMKFPEASKELKHAAPELERAARSASGSTGYAQRRHELARRALTQI